MSVIRATAAIVSLLALKYALHPRPNSTVPEVAIYGPWVAEAVTLVVGGATLMVVFPLLAAEHLRARARKQMRIPLLSLLGSLALLILVVPAAELLMFFYRYISTARFARGVSDGSRALVILGMPFALWIYLTTIFASFIFLRTLCRAQDGHPFLAPTLAILITWSGWIAGFLLPSYYPFGNGIDLLIGLCSAVTATAISVYEINRYRKLYGISLRSGPFPRWVAPDSVTPWYLNVSLWREEFWKQVREPLALALGRIMFWLGVAIAIPLGIFFIEEAAGAHQPFTDSFRYSSVGLGIALTLGAAGWYSLRYYRDCRRESVRLSVHASRDQAAVRSYDTSGTARYGSSVANPVHQPCQSPYDGENDHYRLGHSRNEWSGRAIAALVMVVVFPPAAIILAIAAMADIQHSRKRGIGLAMIALIFGVVAVGFFVRRFSS